MLPAPQLRQYVKRGREDFAEAHKHMERWRRFEHGDSWDAVDSEKLAQRDQKAVVVNVTAPAVDLIVGMLGATQLDFDVRPMIEEAAELAEQETWALKHVATIGELNRIRLERIKDGVVCGVGWVLVGEYVRDPDLRREAVQFAHLPPEWCWCDVTGVDPLVRDAEFMGYSRWMPSQLVYSRYPGARQFIESLRGDPDRIAKMPEVYTAPIQTGTDVSVPSLDEWPTSPWNLLDKNREVDRMRDKYMVHEIFYRERVSMPYYRTKGDDQWKPAETVKNDLLRLRLRPDVVAVTIAPGWVYRRARMIGPYKLEDKRLPVAQYPMLPWFWKRDHRGLPFSFVQQIEHIQQETNARRARALWAANAMQAQLDENAFFEAGYTAQDLERVIENLAKPNGIIPIGMDLLQPWIGTSMQQDQLAWVNRVDVELYKAAGITESLTGSQSAMSPRSGESLRQQGLQAGMTFEARRQELLFVEQQIGQVALEYIVALHKEPFPVLVHDPVQGRALLRQVQMADVQHLVEIEMGPFTPTMLEKQAENLRTLLPMLPPDAQLQGEALMFWLATLNLPGVRKLKGAVADYMRRVAQGAAAPPESHVPAKRPRQPQLGEAS